MNKTIRNLAVIPTQCHMWLQQEPNINNLFTNKEYKDHFMTDADEATRSLKKCNECGQLYLYEFLEWIDWKNGNDPQYHTLVPVASSADADTLATVSQFEIMAHTPQIRRDFPSNAQQASTKWIK